MAASVSQAAEESKVQGPRSKVGKLRRCRVRLGPWTLDFGPLRLALAGERRLETLEQSDAQYSSHRRIPRGQTFRRLLLVGNEGLRHANAVRTMGLPRPLPRP